MYMKHKTVQLIVDSGVLVEAVAPIIISASRATDIPAFYADWFFSRLNAGYIKWQNPFNGKYSYISLKNVRFIVFWTKNPSPLLPYLKQLKEKGIGYYIQFTLNDYEKDGLEPNIPNLNKRIDVYKRIVDEFGRECIVWRFDPMILTNNIGIDELIYKVTNIGDVLYGYAHNLVFSFADIMTYKKVVKNLNAFNVKYREWDECLMLEFAKKLSDLNNLKWRYRLATCAENIDLEEYGIEHNRCIDPMIISKLSPEDIELQNYLYKAKTDSGQRKSCGCIISKDIGQYNTCPHLCRYCYANNTEDTVLLNYQKHINNQFTDKIF